MAFSLALVLALIAANALYVAAEFSAVAVRRSQIQELANSGNSVASSLMAYLEDVTKLDRFIAACQIGITFTSVVLGAFGQYAFAPSLAALLAMLGLSVTASFTVATASVLLVLTSTQVVFGELLPKSLALRFPLATVLKTYRPMALSLIAFAPFIRFLNGSGLLLLKVVGLEFGSHRHAHSAEDIEMIFEQGRAAGILDSKDYHRFREALRLSERRAHQVMVPRLRIKALDVRTPLPQLLTQVANSPYTRLPVYENTIDNIIGQVHTKKLIGKFLEGKLHSINDVLQPPVLVPESLPIGRLLDVFKEERTHQAVVFDEYGSVRGLLTLEDVLSELLGEVADEFKGENPHAVRLADGRIRIPGSMPRHAAYAWTGVEWNGEADTVGGHILYTIGRLPKVGEHFDIEGVNVEIETVSKYRISSIIVQPNVQSLEGSQ